MLLSHLQGGNWQQGCAAVCASCQGMILAGYLMYWHQGKYRCETQKLAQGEKFTQEAEAADRTQAALAELINLAPEYMSPLSIEDSEHV